MRIITLARRSDFLRAAQARRQGAPGFLLQARRRDEGEAGPSGPSRDAGDAGRPGPGPIRVGFTCSRKLGNAVTRNRARRRLRAVARAVLPEHGRAGWDYVLVGRPGATVERPFAALVADLVRALGQIHARERRE